MKQKPPQNKQEIKARIKKPVFDAALMFATEEQSDKPKQREAVNRSRPEGKPAKTIRADSLLPSKGELAESFAKRAAHYAQTDTRQRAEIDIDQFQNISVGRQAFGVPYQYVDEIMYARHITGVPCAPNYVRGVISLGGEYLCIIDLGILFQTKSIEMTQDTSIVVVQGAGIRAGLLVQKVGNNESYHPGMISQPMRSEGPVKRSYIKGIYNQTVTFLDIDAMLTELSSSIAS